MFPNLTKDPFSDIVKIQEQKEQIFKLPKQIENLSASSAKKANCRRIAEILERYADDYYVANFLELLIDRHKPEQQRLSIVNDAEL